MPELDRPNTDIQRLKALQSAKIKADAVLPGPLAFGPATLAALIALLPNFATEMQQRGTALSGQSSTTAAINPYRKRVRMFISHFLRVFNIGVERGVYAASERAHYQLPVSSEKLPNLSSDEDLVLWAGNIAAGDAARVTAGGAPMTNPTAAEVAAEFALYEPMLATHTTAKDAYDSEQEDVEDMRPQVDDLINDIWDEVLFTFRKDSPSSMRRKAREYGVVYRLSPGEEPQPDEFSISGKVTLLPTVTDPAEDVPLEDVQVRAVEDNITVLTDGEGNYLMPLLSVATATIEFSKPGFITRTENDVTITPGEIVELNVELEAEV
jgi:hypothetical protein